MKTKIILILFFLIIFNFSIYSIPVNINSGNPTMPFPQFINYKGGDSLASHLPDGVTLAEMEQWIRDAYQIMMNRANYDSTIVDGIQYIHFGSSPDCTEGDGYALLAAAIMGDKDTFDGLWMWIHDNRMNKVQRYSDGGWNNQTYKYGRLPGWTGVGADSAADGDFDIAMALLIAWKQWGDNSGINTAIGPMSYRDEALNFIRALVEWDEGDNIGDSQYTSGDVGFDGYIKGGNTWQELTGWATGQNPGPQFSGPTQQHVDYYAPAYFSCFANVLQSEGDPQWNITQSIRAYASSDWVMGQIYSHGWIPTAGWVSVSDDGSSISVSNFTDGEDFRNPWRTHLNYLWNGPPQYSWDPVNHVTITASNTYEYDSAVHYANFLKDPQAAGAQSCASYGSSPVTYKGTATLVQQYNPTSWAAIGAYHLNWIFGTSSPAVVISQDFDLMGEFFREAMIEWDVDSAGDGYLTSVPKYFHGWFRLLALLVLTGNHISPCDWNVQANMKVFKSVSKTYSFPTDTITYWLNYRNYASVDATNVVIRDTLPSIFEFISSTPAATDLGSNIYEWNIGTVPGLQNQNYAATMGGVTLVVRVKDDAVQGKYCNTADIRCNNGTGWTTDDIANNISTVMETNCVDIVANALQITKTASKYLANAGDTITYTIEYCNSSDAGWINGGRSGVNFSFAVDSVPGTSDTTLTFYLRANHEAAEPVIDWGNYRISYFLNSPYHGTDWTVDIDIAQGFDPATTIVTTEDLVPGSDAQGSWNQRVIIQFGSETTVPTHHLFNYYGMPSRIHQGTTTEPFLMKARLHAGWNTQDWTDDWSQQTSASVASQNDPLYPISPDWTAGDGTSIPVWKINKHACETATHNIENILIEEWDGYTWRRVFGNGPQPGREVTNVVITDSLPAEVTFGGFIGTTGTKTGNTLQWNIGNLQVNECGSVSYWVTVNDPGLTPPYQIYADNIAFIDADKEAPVSDSVRVTITSDVLPTPTPAPASITKSANATTFNINDTITYTIEYTNTYGSIIDAPLTNQSDWTNRGNMGDLTVSGGQISSVGNQNTTMTYNYSHGVNGTIIARLHVASNAVFGIAFRHNGTTINDGEYITFKPNPPNTGEIRFWEGSTEVGSTTLPGTLGNDFDVKIELDGSTVRLYLKKTTDTDFPVLPDYTQTMTVKSGYAGVINGTPTNQDAYSSSHYCSSWHTELDTSINTLIYDPLPAGINFLGGDNGAYLDTSIVKWPLIPFLEYGQSITYNWWGEINVSCQNITNTAYAQPTGISTQIADGNIVNVLCTNTTPTNTPTSTETLTNTLTPSPSYTSTVTHTITFTQTSTNTLSPTLTLTITSTPTYTETITYTFTDTVTGTPPPTNTFTETFTETLTFTYTPTPTYTETITYTFTDTVTGTPPPTNTFTETFTETLTFTYTPTPTYTETNTYTFTNTVTGTPPPTNTFTETFTVTNTYTVTYTYTFSQTPTNTFTFTDTHTPSPTNTYTYTYTSTYTFTNTFTFTETFTYTSTFTETYTPTITPTPLPSPVNLSVELYAEGDYPKEGGIITYKIVIKNNSQSSVSNINVWDTLPQEVEFLENNFSVEPSIDTNSNYILWDLSGNILLPGDLIIIKFKVKITNIDSDRLPITNKVAVDYNDPLYTPSYGKHPPVYSDLSFFPVNKIVIYPNPINFDKKILKFDNVPPGATISIFTLSGENVITLSAENKIKVLWDGKNRYGKKVSPGIYLVIVKTNGDIQKGKVFVIGN